MFDRFRRGGTRDSDSDADLYRAIGRGHEDAMGVLYRRHGGLVYRFALRLSQDPSIAEEVTQDVFMALLRSSDRFDPNRGALPTWLCGIARRLVWRQLERRSRSLLFEVPDNDHDAECPADDPAV